MTYSLLPWHIFLCSGFNGIFPHCRPTITSDYYSSHLLKAGMNILISWLTRRSCTNNNAETFFSFLRFVVFSFLQSFKQWQFTPNEESHNDHKRKLLDHNMKNSSKIQQMFYWHFLLKGFFFNWNICMAWVFSIQEIILSHFVDLQKGFRNYCPKRLQPP